MLMEQQVRLLQNRYFSRQLALDRQARPMHARVRLPLVHESQACQHTQAVRFRRKARKPAGEQQALSAVGTPMPGNLRSTRLAFSIGPCNAWSRSPPGTSVAIRAH